jgi:hypothetical protein
MLGIAGSSDALSVMLVLSKLAPPYAQAPGMRETLRDLRDVPRAPAGTPPVPDITMLQVRHSLAASPVAVIGGLCDAVPTPHTHSRRMSPACWRLVVGGMQWLVCLLLPALIEAWCSAPLALLHVNA